MSINSHALTGTLEAIEENTEGDKIDVGTLVSSLNARGFGPLLIGPSLIVILPTGAIPGMPSICALMLIFVSVQIMVGRKNPWLPSRLKDISFSRETFINVISKSKPYTKKIDKFIYPRLEILTSDKLIPLIALLSIVLSVAVSILGFIPFLAALPALGILMLGVGLTAHDGVWFVGAFVVMIASLALFPWAYDVIFGS